MLNDGLFNDNGGCGYVLKPEFMRTDANANEFGQDLPQQAISTRILTLRVISGYLLPPKSGGTLDPYVQVPIYA